MGRQVSPATVGPQDINVITPVAAVSTQASVIVRNMGGVRMEMMLDSGSSVSLIQEESIPYNAGIVKVRPAPRSQLVTASGEKLKIIDYVSASVQLGEWHIDHNFFVVNRLVAPVILGIDFLQRGELVLDFTSTPVKVTKGHKQRTEPKQPQEVRDTPSDWQEIHETVLQAKQRFAQLRLSWTLMWTSLMSAPFLILGRQRTSNHPSAHTQNF